VDNGPEYLSQKEHKRNGPLLLQDGGKKKVLAVYYSITLSVNPLRYG